MRLVTSLLSTDSRLFNLPEELSCILISRF
nr:MAG TPA: hypothetical protein [Caudoviricetes sp.]